MAHLEVTDIRSYAQLDEWLGERQSRRLGYKTIAWRSNENRKYIAIRQWNTDIYTITPDDIATLDVGNWFTVTTKDRLNKLLPRPMLITSDRGRWYISTSVWNPDTETWVGKIQAPLANGIQINVREHYIVANPGASALDEQDAHNKNMRKLIKSYVDGLTDEVWKSVIEDAEANGVAGDCLFCNIERNSSQFGDDEHLISHLEEKYYMYSLMYTACRDAKYGDPQLIVTMFPDLVRRSLTKYFRKRLLKGVAI